MSAQIYWSREEPPVSTQTEKDFESTLDRIAVECRKAPSIARVMLASGDQMLIGLGDSDWSFVEFVAAGGRRLASGTPRTPSANVTRNFYYFGAHSEIAARALIPIASARTIAREFFTTGKLSDAIDWSPGGAEGPRRRKD
jgi:hypothetical protein